MRACVCVCVCVCVCLSVCLSDCLSVSSESLSGSYKCMSHNFPHYLILIGAEVINFPDQPTSLQ